MLEPNKNRRKVVAATLIAGLVFFGLIGGAFANLNKSITDGPTKHSIHSDGITFDFGYTVDSGTINADISLKAPAKAVTIKVENTGDFPANAAFYIDPESITGLDLDNPIFKETNVSVIIGRDGQNLLAPSNGNGLWTLKEFLTTAYITNIVLAPQGIVHYQITIVPSDPARWSSSKTAAAFSQSFETKSTFSQIGTNGSSPLVTYAEANGLKTKSFPAPGTFSYTIPVSDLSNITL